MSKNNSGNLSENSQVTCGISESANAEAENTVCENKLNAACYDAGQSIEDALKREEVRQLIYENDEIVNEIIERYLRSLSCSSVPVVRGLSALTPVPKPKTLDEAKAIVDGK